LQDSCVQLLGFLCYFLLVLVTSELSSLCTEILPASRTTSYKARDWLPDCKGNDGK